MSKTTMVALASTSAPTGTQTSSAVDLSDFTGNCQIFLDCAAPASAETLDVKLQHSDTSGGTYTDTGDVFAQVTNAGGASFQTLTVSVDKFKKYVKVVQTKVGTTALARGVYLVGNKAF
jgi:hypothetical protein